MHAVVVRGVGSNVSRFHVGDRVAWQRVGSSYAEKVVAGAIEAVPVPAEVSLENAGAVLMQGLTAMRLVYDVAGVEQGQIAIVHSAGSGTGRMLTQFVKLAGGKVIGTVSRPEKADAARTAGADAVVVYTQNDFSVVARQFTGGRGVDVVFEGIGLKTYERNRPGTHRSRVAADDRQDSAGSRPLTSRQPSRWFVLRPGGWTDRTTPVAIFARRILTCVTRRHGVFVLTSHPSRRLLIALGPRETSGRLVMKSHATIGDWIASGAIPFSVDSSASIDAAVDKIMGSLGDSVELLGFGEALHGSEEILLVRNRVFQRLAAVHGYSAIVIEVTSPQARAMNEYILGMRQAEDEAVQAWFGSGFGLLDANRELVEWMRTYNADSAHSSKLHFYGFDLPLRGGGLASPSLVLDIVFEYLEAIDIEAGKSFRERVTPLIGNDSDWERSAAMFDPTQSVGLSTAAIELRIATEDLITQLRIRGPELIGKSDRTSYLDALHHAQMTRQLLNAHAALAREDAYSEMLGLRDLIMADHLQYLVGHERERGRVMVFAHSGHLKKTGRMQWELTEHEGAVKEWWPAGTQLNHMLGERYAMIGMALGSSEPNGIGKPEEGTLEARLGGAGGPLFIPTRSADGLPPAEIADLPVRGGSALNPTYNQVTAESFSDFDWLVFFDSTGYPRGSTPLTEWNG